MLGCKIQRKTKPIPTLALPLKGRVLTSILRQRVGYEFNLRRFSLGGRFVTR
jgi:hypothetical protein